MDGFEKRRDEKKKAVLQAAFALFDQYGFDRVTVTDIAEKAHVSKVSIYNFFESKDNLRRIIMKNLFDEAIAQKAAFIEAERPFIEKIGGFIQLQTQYYGRHSLPFFFEAIESDPVIRQYFDEYSGASRKLVCRFIDAGKKAGAIPAGISDLAIEIYVDIFESYFLQNKNNLGIILERNPELAQEINMLFLDGLIQNSNVKG
ncbi:MAG: TetR/AcrR family transcriptional regulator [Clostridiales bacterium]|nr:TetR/AcrR family transcriptional regulator [Clostridiales bacterium]